MSRIGKQPISVPSGVEVTIDGSAVRVKGPKGQLEHRIVGDIAVERDGDALSVTRRDDSRSNRSLHGLQRSLIANMVVGVSDGFVKELELAVGYSHPVRFEAPEGITFEVPQPTRVIVRGHDKQLVGQVAADIRKIRKPEPYKGKGIRYANEYIRRKAGKSAK
jgi:large subunit ribosomal protein L6